MIRLPRRIPSATLFGGAPSQTYAPSQGSIYFYTDSSCNTPLTENPMNLILGQCENTPFAGIKGVSLQSLPTCGNGGSPILIISENPDCKSSNSSGGSPPGTGETELCLVYSSGVDIGSVQLICYGSGLSTTSTMEYPEASDISNPTTTAGAVQGGSTESQDDNSGGSCCTCDCCCCCIVM